MLRGYFIFVGVFALVLLLVTLPLFIMRRKFEPIASRGWRLVAASQISGSSLSLFIL